MEIVEDKTLPIKRMDAHTDIPQITINEFDQAYEEFKNTLAKLSEKFQRTETSVIKSLLENICEYRVKYLLEHGNNGSNSKFDRYFSIKHEFIKNKLLQKLTGALRRQGIKTCIATEEKNYVGIFDIVIHNKQMLISIKDNKLNRRIIVELKGGNSFDLTQIERYLWECDTLILVRILTKQVIRISRKQVEKYLTISLQDLKERTIDIAEDIEAQKIPGPYCRGCLVHQCEFYKSENKRMIAYNNESMENDMISIFTNIHDCIDNAINIVIGELRPSGNS